jgi:hypothetical protein
MFYYSQPNAKQVGKKIVKDGVAGDPITFKNAQGSLKQYLMLSDVSKFKH